MKGNRVSGTMHKAQEDNVKEKQRKDYAEQNPFG